MSLALLSRLFEWRDALVVVRPETLIRWHRAGWRLFWRLKSRPGRTRIPLELRQLIRRMATENPIWGEERIANELLLELGLRVSLRTVRTDLPKRQGRPRGDQRWLTILRNHAHGMLACDFFVAVTATFRLLCVFAVIEHGSRRLVLVAETAHPSAAWTLQQLREVVGFDHARRYLIHDRDSIFARSLDESIRNLGLSVLKSPPHSPKANAICERVIGTIRRECLDWLILLSESHLRSILRAWVGHYNRGRPHMALGPGVPAPPHRISCSLQHHQPAIGSASASECAPGRCWATCTTSTCRGLRRRDPLIAEHTRLRREGVRLSGSAQHLVYFVLVGDLLGDHVAGVLLEAHIPVLHQVEKRVVGLECFAFYLERLAQDVADVVLVGLQQRADAE